MDVISRFMKVWKLIQDAKDPNWNIDTELYGNVRPPDELKGLLDTYIKDEAQKKMFLEASQKQEP